jgi:hypothetical protein
VTVVSPPDSRTQVVGRLPRDAGHDPGDLARLALDRIAQDHRRDAGVQRRLRRGLQGVLRSSDQPELRSGQARVARLGCLVQRRGQVPRHGRGRRDAVLLQDRAGLGEAGRVRHGRAGGDHRRVVPRHVGDRQGDDARGRRSTRQAPALDRREVLPDAVHLGDVGAAGEQRAGDRLLVLERQSRRRQGQQRRAAARDQTEQQVFRREPPGPFEDALGGPAPGGVGHRVGRLDHLDPPAVQGVAVAGHDKAIERPLPMLLDRLGHGRRRLASADHDGAAGRRRGQVPRQGLAWVGGGQRRVEQGAQEGAGIFEGHGGGTPVALGWVSRRPRPATRPTARKTIRLVSARR